MGRHGTIAGRKDAQDKKRAAAFTKVVRLITVAAREGADPEYNVNLKHALEKAKAVNMPNDNIKRAIQKGAGNGEADVFTSVTYEGYGPGGVAIIVETLTDNKNRTVANVKNAFDKLGGNLGVSGSVSYMFDRKGVIEIEKNNKTNEDEILGIALDAGMDDMVTYDDSFYITTPLDSFDEVKDALKSKEYDFIEADIEYVPSIEVETLSDEDKEKLLKLIDKLEDDDDVQKVHHNYVGSFE